MGDELHLVRIGHVNPVPFDRVEVVRRPDSRWSFPGGPVTNEVGRVVEKVDEPP